MPSDVRGERLDRHLSSVFPDITRSQLKTLIDEGHVLVSGHEAKAAKRLKGGELVELNLPAPRSSTIVPQDLPLHVLFEDPDVIVVDKEAGMVVHPAAGHWDKTLANALLFRLGDIAQVGSSVRPGLVHRLDKDTSGCLLIAKNSVALQSLQAQFKDRTLHKLYLAIVHGAPTAEGRIETLLGRHPVHRKRFTSKTRIGKKSLTLFRTKERFPGATLLEVDLKTGRTHQIRVHLSENGFPLLGDPLYGGRRRPVTSVREAESRLGRQALHAWKLRFAHPRTHKEICVEAPLPQDFQEALAILRSANRTGKA